MFCFFFFFFFFVFEEAATKCLCIPTAFSKSCLLSLKVWKALNEKSLTGQVTTKGFGLLELETGLCIDSSVQKQKAQSSDSRQCPDSGFEGVSMGVCTILTERAPKLSISS